MIIGGLIQKYRKSINPPYNRKDALTILATLVVLLAIPLTVFSILTVRNWQPKAAPAGVPRGVERDLWADVIIGKPDFSEINPDTIVPNKLFVPRAGVIIDRTSLPQKLYVNDSGNNRILGFDWDSCRSSTTNPLGCSAGIVLGQPNMSTSACNGDSGFQDYPNRAPASAATLCSQPEDQLSTGEGASGSSMAIDSQGNLYVTDFFNHRVLKYNQPFSTDKTGGKGDSVADDVWGQSDFSGESCNKGMSAPDATSLCFSWGHTNNWTAGVDVDSAGNVWVVDSGNNRVLRFPPGLKTADLVIGQTDFTSATAGSALNKFDDPSAVRLNSLGWVYVADHGNNRVLRFKSPSTVKYGENFGSGFDGPNGVDFDPTEPGHVWINDLVHRVVELWNETTKLKIREVGRWDDGNVLGNGGGSVGIDSDGNIVATAGNGGAEANDVLLFEKVNPPPTKQTTFRNIFGPGRGNLKTASGISASRGVVVSNNQLISADDGRLEFWNNPSSLTNGKPADGVAGYNRVTHTGVSSPTDPADIAYGCCWVMKADKNNNLFVAVDNDGSVQQHIDIFHLPLTNGAAPYKTITLPLPVLGGGQISSMSPWGIAVTDNSDFLWVTDSDNSRVFRVRTPLTSPVVDVILGQTSLSGNQCNRGAAPISGATPTTLCWPGSLSLDRLGNLYVSDDSLEVRGNIRLLEFNQSLFPTNNTSVIYAPAASKIFPNTAAWGQAFDSQNRMVVGYNAYRDVNPQHGWFPGVYNDPLGPSTSPDSLLKDYYSIAFAATFDSNDNLYVGDGIRARVLIYENPLGGGGPGPKPGDLNGDNKVDILDLSILLTNWGATSGPADINKDGAVDVFDLSILLTNWGS